jgi:hypothetical protein
MSTIRLEDLTRLALSLQAILMLVTLLLTLDEDHTTEEGLHLRVTQISRVIQGDRLDTSIIIR